MDIITDIPICQKDGCDELCKPSKWTKSGYTAYCSREHANARSHSDETKKKTRASVKKYQANNPDKSVKGMKFYSRDSVSRIFSVLPIPDDLDNKFYFYKFDNSVYKRILADYSCEICHNSHWNNKRIYLEIDHIDGDNKNNRLENLRVLCRNCHSQTETFTRRKNKKVSFEYRIYGPIHLDSYKRNFESLTKATMRKIIFNEQNNSCLFCGMKEWCDKPLAFEMDHISGNRSDNRRDNLRILCPNCHASTDTFRQVK